MTLDFSFYTYKKLQGSQTRAGEFGCIIQFYTYKKLQGSQTTLDFFKDNYLFYTYLKLQGSQTLNAPISFPFMVLHLSEITRFSNEAWQNWKEFVVLHLSEITRFSNSYAGYTIYEKFYTYLKLQGSQTWETVERSTISFTLI